MSYLDTKQALLTLLLDATITGITANDIAFENKFFDPANKSLWLAAYFIPVSSEILGKTDASGDEQRGIFQISVYIPLDDKADFDNKQLAAIDEILTAFKYNTTQLFNSQKVDILSSTVNGGIETESWFKRDISINYLTFSNR